MEGRNRQPWIVALGIQMHSPNGKSSLASRYPGFTDGTRMVRHPISTRLETAMPSTIPTRNLVSTNLPR